MRVSDKRVSLSDALSRLACRFHLLFFTWRILEQGEVTSWAILNAHKWCMHNFPKDVLASNNKSLTKKWFWWKINLLSVFTAIFTTVKSKSMNKRRQQWQFEIIKKILRSLSYSVFNLSNKIHRVYAGWKCHLCALRKGTNYGKCGRKSTGTTVKKLMF